MQNIVNQKKVENGARLGKIATFVGLGCLGGGLVVSLMFKDSSLLWLSFVFLLLGLVISSVGTMNMNRWVREPRADQALGQGLKGFDDRYQLYNYYLPVRHVLLSPVGLYVLIAMGQDGAIRYEDGKFRRDFSLGRALRFMAEEGLGKPFAEADDQVKKMRAYLDENGIHRDIEVYDVVVFYNPAAQLQVGDLPQPVVTTKGLKKSIRKQRDRRLTNNQYAQLEELFDRSLE
jgi:hypothetical protein